MEALAALAFGSAATTATATAAAAPATMGLFGAGSSFALMPTLATVGTTMTGLGLISQGMGQSELASANAEIARREAGMKQEAAKEDTLKISREARQMAGTQAALYGSSGVSLASGSPLEVMAQSAAEYERAIHMRGYSGDVGAANSLYQAEMYEYGGKQKMMSGLISGGGTLLTGYGRSLLGKY